MLRLLVTAGPLRSFQVRNYRFLWTSNASVRLAEQMQVLVLSWYVVTETGSPFLLGLFGALRFSGTLFGAAYGVVVDRSNRRRLLVGVRLAISALSVALLLLVLAGRLEPWHVFILTAFGGLARAFDNIIRQTLLGDVIRRDELINALALDRTGSDASQMLGPLVGGVLLSRFDMGPAFAVIVVVNLMATVLAFWVRPASPAPAPLSSSMWRNLAEGGGYIIKHDTILALLIFAFLVNLAAFPLTHGMMPVFAQDVLHTGPLGLAALTSAVAAGAFVGSFTLATRRWVARPGILTIGAVLGWLIAVLFFTRSQWMDLSLAILLVAGVSQSFGVVTMDSLLLRLCPVELRGRIMGVRSMTVYGMPMGLLLAGALASVLGAPTAIAIIAAGGVAMVVVVALWLRGLWTLP